VGVNDNIEDERCILKIFIPVTRRVKGIISCYTRWSQSKRVINLIIPVTRRVKGY